jgi:hypothetical protein
LRTNWRERRREDRTTESASIISPARFAEHLVDIGVAQPVPLTAAQIARAAMLADYEAYLVKQRGLSPRTIYHVLRFADRFLDHRFGAAMIDLTRLSAADAVGFVQHVLADRHWRARHYSSNQQQLINVKER